MFVLYCFNLIKSHRRLISYFLFLCEVDRPDRLPEPFPDEPRVALLRVTICSVSEDVAER